MPPIAREHPSTLAELVAIVKQAAATGRRLKVVGSLGEAAMSATDGVLIVLDNYRRLLRVDRARRRVTVEAGCRVGRLSRVLGGWGLALDDPAPIARRSVGGAVSTGSHGWGARSTGLGGAVTGLDLVLADGTLLTCSGDEEPEIFDAARVGLGALGVVSSVTLQCEPGFNLLGRTRVMRLDSLLERFGSVVDGDDHVEFSWLPSTRMAMVTTRNRTEAPAGWVRGGYIDRGYRVRPRPRRLPEPAMEYSVPRAAAGPLLEQLSVRRRVAASPIRVTVSADDSLPLSPASGRPSVFIGVNARVAPAVEALLVGVAGARPQWGTDPRRTAANLRPLYPEWDAWQAVRRRLDPAGRFTNAWTERALGPVR